MKYILRESFDFNNVIENDINTVANDIAVNILLNIITEKNIQNIVNKIAPKFKISIKTLDKAINIKIFFRIGYPCTINLIYNSNNIVDVYVKEVANAKNSLLAECIISILNYLKSICININEVIFYNINDIKTNSDNIYLWSEDTTQLLSFIKNNYKIKLVDLPNEENNVKISNIKIEARSIEDFDLVKNNIININKDTICYLI